MHTATVRRPTFVAVGLLTLCLGPTGRADDWPQFRGPDRTGLSREKGLLQSWPKDGPKLLWKATGLGGGFATVAIAKGRIYSMGFLGNDEVVYALNAADGKEIWKVRTAAAKKGIDHGEGPRCTPTVDGDRLYALGLAGDLVCLNAADGKEVWRHNLGKDYGGNVGSWGWSESPLVDGDKVIAVPGGKTTMVAFNKLTGDVLWKAQAPEGDGAEYASAIATDIDGQRQYVTFMKRGVVSISADGKFLWRYNKPANGVANCSMPVVAGASVFASSDYGNGGGLVKVVHSGGEFKAEEVYFTKDMKNHHGGMVLVNGNLYGSDGGVLACIEFETGKVRWKERKAGKGSIAYADGCLYYRNEGGPMFLVEATPSGYVEHGQFNPPDRSDKNAWSYPVVANGRLYLRDQDVLLCYDVKK